MDRAREPFTPGEGPQVQCPGKDFQAETVDISPAILSTFTFCWLGATISQPERLEEDMTTQSVLRPYR